MTDKYLDYTGTDLLWRKILRLLNKKLESVTNSDDSIKITDKNKISVKISASENNLLRLKPGEGLYVPDTPVVLHKLTFGSDKNYVYDGTEDVTVPVYPGNYNE